jgi:hypothetical protein
MQISRQALAVSRFFANGPDASELAVRGVGGHAVSHRAFRANRRNDERFAV